jgi:hypothetical protein
MLIETTKTAQRDDLRGLAAAALWDAGKRDIAREIAKNLIAQKGGLFSAAWSAMVLLADAGRFSASMPVAHEPAVRWMQAGWLE